jgi:hypothetical protein
MAQLRRHNLSNPRGRIEQIRKPAHEGGYLDVADPPDWFRQVHDGFVDC